jgi:hypothetical protein
MDSLTSPGNNLATAHALCTLMTGWISLKKLKSLSLEILSNQLDCSVIWILHINNFFHIVFHGNVPFALKSMIYFKRSYFLAILYVLGTNPSCLSTHWYLVAKLFPELRVAAKYVIDLCAIVRIEDEKLLCDKCGMFYFNIIEHILFSCDFVSHDKSSAVNFRDVRLSIYTLKSIWVNVYNVSP